MTAISPEKLLKHLFRTAVNRALPDQCLPEHLRSITHERIHVIGAGKAAAAMAAAVENHYRGEISGIVVTRYGHLAACDKIKVIEAAHPIPDKAGILAAEQILKSVSAIQPHTLAVFLISGGASALLSLPHEGVDFATKQSVNRKLLLCGASIHEINCVRKHLSAIKGGRLMKRIYPASALTLCISDVADNDPSVIGSGPTVPDATTCADVLDILTKYGIQVPAAIEDSLRSNCLETPKPADPIFSNSSVRIVADAAASLSAAAGEAGKSGFEAVLWSDSIQGDTNEAANAHAQFVRELIAQRTDNAPFVVLSGGETTVHVKNKGKGGPNTQFVLALALALKNLDGIYAIACDTDGIDGSQNNAGAMIHPDTLKAAKAKNLDARAFVENNDSFSFFEATGGLVTTGPTLTNVNDFRAIYVDPARVSQPL